MPEGSHYITAVHEIAASSRKAGLLAITIMFEIANLTRQKVDKVLLKKVARQAVAVLGKKGMEEISLVLVGDVKIKQLNKKYLRRNRVTDVLSFEGLNEIFICLPQAKKQAKALKTTLNCELTRLLVHGIVHLKGYEHEKSAKEAERMFGVEDKILKNLLIKNLLIWKKR